MQRLLLFLVMMLAAGTVRAAVVEDALAVDPARDETFPATMVELVIPSRGARLPGHIYLASGAGPHPTVVFLHGLPGNERNLDIAQALRRLGFNTLFFHYRGAWGAEGDFRLTQLPEDALEVLAWLRADAQREALRVDAGRLSVLGHSLGGYAALAAGAQDDELACVIALAPANLGLWRDEAIAGGGATIERLRSYADSLFMLAGLGGQRLVEELAWADRRSLDTAGFGADLAGRAVLMIVGERDEATPPATMFDPVVAAYRREPGLDLTALKLDDDHSFSNQRVALTRAVLTWADQRCR